MFPLRMILVLLSALLFACGSNPIIGVWKVTREYDYFHEEWKHAREETTLQLERDGKFVVVRADGSRRKGTFTVDNDSEPSRIVLRDEKRVVVSGIYRVENGKLILRTIEQPRESEFPSSFDPKDGEAPLTLVELERR